MKKILLPCICMVSFLLSGCKKFLDEKPDIKLVVPATLRDLQALLDDNTRVNVNPASLEISADDYYLTNADWASTSQETHRRMYLWKKDFLFEPTPSEWLNLYRTVYYANSVLEVIPGIEKYEFNKSTWESVYGQAYFVRGKTFLELASVWALAYDPATASTRLGIPLRLSTDFNIRSQRASLQQTYEQIANDLHNAVQLLPLHAVHVMRPSRAAAYAMLARTYLYMQDYAKALAYADSSLSLNNQLLNYNNYSPTASFPFPRFNAELLYVGTFNAAHLQNTKAKIDSALIASYAADDLRKSLFFKNNGNNTFGFKGSYEGSTILQHGPTTAEMYLTRAECFARQGNISQAMADLNTLLLKRWKTNRYVTLTAGTKEEALALILLERRKELVFRGLRWMDLKRLNQGGANITARRFLNAEWHVLEPNDLRYALPLPEDIVELAGIPQNPR